LVICRRHPVRAARGQDHEDGDVAALQERDRGEVNFDVVGMRRGQDVE
jgi:hypothetical protein